MDKLKQAPSPPASEIAPKGWKCLDMDRAPGPMVVYAGN